MAVNSDDFRARCAAADKARGVIEKWQRGGDSTDLERLITEALMPGAVRRLTKDEAETKAALLMPSLGVMAFPEHAFNLLVGAFLEDGVIAEFAAPAGPGFYCVIGTRAYDRKFKTSMQEAINHASNLFSRPGCGAPLLIVKVAQIVEPLPPSVPRARARDPLDSDRRMLGLE